MACRKRFVVSMNVTGLKKSSYIYNLVALVVSATTLAYFFWHFKIEITVTDFFYDADTPRTLLYVTDPSNAISSIRPFLFLVSWIPYVFNTILQPYLAWCLFNVCCILISTFAIRRIFWETNIPLRNLGFLLTNLSLLCWTVVPDTFIVGITFFVLGVLVYGDGSKSYRVILSGIVATSLNVFFLVPWLTAHIFLGRKTLVQSVGRAFASITIVAFMLLSSQYLQRFKPLVQIVDGRTSMDVTKPFRELPFDDELGILSSIDSIRWFHSPFIGLGENLLSFFTAPWTQGYRYVSGTWAVDSDFLPFAVLFLAVLLTVASYFGIYFMRKENRVFVSFVFCLEIATCILFLTYSTHPFLFAPFVLASRIFGLIFFVYKFGIAFFPLILISSILTVSSLQYMP
jgi:hypothetical protein